MEPAINRSMIDLRIGWIFRAIETALGCKATPQLENPIAVQRPILAAEHATD
jgi:hypothetical protein